MNHCLYKGLILIITCLSLTTSQASASTTNDPRNQLQLVGEATMSYLFWDVYRARLYTSSGHYQANLSHIAIEYNYLIDIDANDLVSETANQWRKLGLSTHPEESQWLQRLQEIWPDIQKGEQLLFYIDRSNQALFFHNGRYLGRIESEEFSRRFKSIWLDEKTTAPDVRRGLLGADTD